VLRGISIPCTSREKYPSQDCDGIVDKASKQKGIPTVIVWEYAVPYSEFGANEKKKSFPCFFGKLEVNVLLFTACNLPGSHN